MAFSVWTVEVAIAGMPQASGSMLHNPDVVAKFIETIAKKLEEIGR
jgi:hypothetical protein